MEIFQVLVPRAETNKWSLEKRQMSLQKQPQNCPRKRIKPHLRFTFLSVRYPGICLTFRGLWKRGKKKINYLASNLCAFLRAVGNGCVSRVPVPNGSDAEYRTTARKTTSAWLDLSAARGQFSL